MVAAGEAVGQKGRGGSELRVAVASNFAPTLRQLAAIYRSESTTEVKVIAASTGKLYAQIIHGAPFDIFLSADSRYPRLLVEGGHAVASSRFTYALGRIALWMPAEQLKQQQLTECRAVLERGEFRRLAIANPATAPYGQAAQQLLQQLGLWQSLQSRLVRGENIAQALHFVESGNAQLGIVALSLVKPLQGSGDCIWEIPAELYQPLEQQAVQLQRGSQEAAPFLAFLASPRARAVMVQNGYGVK